MKAVMYGAGNIGRGFIGQLLYLSGYETAFVDVADPVIEQLNTQHCYPVRTLYKEGSEEMLVKNVSCVDGKDPEAVATAIAEADLMATAVGVNVLKFIIKNIAQGLRKRWEDPNKAPLNIIICENLIGADTFLKNSIAAELNDEENTFVVETGTDDKKSYIKLDKQAIYQTASPVEETATEEKAEEKADKE